MDYSSVVKAMPYNAKFLLAVITIEERVSSEEIMHDNFPDCMLMFYHKNKSLSLKFYRPDKH